MVCAFLALLLTWALSASPAAAEKRVALIVANAAYSGAPLVNPPIDAQMIDKSLRQAGFDTQIVLDASLDGFDSALGAFAERARGADVALFYYAGHGFAVNEGLKPVNVLMGVNADLTSGSERVMRAGGIPLDEIVGQLSGLAKATLVFIDACRNTPRSRRGVGGDGRGLTSTVNFTSGGLYVAVSTQLGDTAYDGPSGRGSPFARAFAAVMTTRGLRIDDAFRLVRDRVSAETGGKQVPDVVKDDLPSGSLALLPAPPPAMAPAGPCGGLVALASLKSRSPETLSRDERCALKAGDVFKECADCPEMVVIPAGSNYIGAPDAPTKQDRIELSTANYPNEGPRHVVNIAQMFAVDRYDVTRDEFEAFVRATGYDAGSACTADPMAKQIFKDLASASWRNPGFAQTGAHPVVCVNWDAAKVYANWISRRTGQRYRLLSSAEWEYAARGVASPGDYHAFYFGDDRSALCSHANVADLTLVNGGFFNPAPLTAGSRAKPAKLNIEDLKKDGGTSFAFCSDGFVFTSPVGFFEPNAFSLFDMAGNVWQWVEDCASAGDENSNHDSYVGAPADGAPDLRGDCINSRTIRGGSFTPDPGAWRAADHLGIDPAQRFNSVGIRLARTLE